MELRLLATAPTGLTEAEIYAALEQSLAGRRLRKVLLLPPDYTRQHSYAGRIAAYYYHFLRDRGVEVRIMPALGTHAPVSREEWESMYGDIPFEEMLVHHWRDGVVQVGEVTAEYLREITDGLWDTPIRVEINREVLDPSYDLILSLGQVVPHEVIGMSNHAKNLFVGVGGSDMIHKSHMVGAVYGMERMMGRDHTPVRKIFDECFRTFLGHLPIVFVLTVTTASRDDVQVHGLFIGEGRDCLTDAVALAQKKNIDFVPHGIKTCVVYLDPQEFKSTWLGNKAIYRTRMAMEDGGRLIILAPGIRKFGEDPICDQLIRKYGYHGRLETLEAFHRPENLDLRENMGVAAHLIHGSSDGRFQVVYAVRDIPAAEMEAVGYQAVSYAEMAARYNPAVLRDGFQMVDGEEVFFISNPALGLWVRRDAFKG